MEPIEKIHTGDDDETVLKDKVNLQEAHWRCCKGSKSWVDATLNSMTPINHITAQPSTGPVDGQPPMVHHHYHHIMSPNKNNDLDNNSMNIINNNLDDECKRDPVFDAQRHRNSNTLIFACNVCSSTLGISNSSPNHTRMAPNHTRIESSIQSRVLYLEPCINGCRSHESFQQKQQTQRHRQTTATPRQPNPATATNAMLSPEGRSIADEVFPRINRVCTPGTSLLLDEHRNEPSQSASLGYYKPCRRLPWPVQSRSPLNPDPHRTDLGETDTDEDLRLRSGTVAESLFDEEGAGYQSFSWSRNVEPTAAQISAQVTLPEPLPASPPAESAVTKNVNVFVNIDDHRTRSSRRRNVTVADNKKTKIAIGRSSSTASTASNYSSCSVSSNSHLSVVYSYDYYSSTTNSDNEDNSLGLALNEDLYRKEMVLNEPPRQEFEEFSFNCGGLDGVRGGANAPEASRVRRCDGSFERDLVWDDTRDLVWPLDLTPGKFDPDLRAPQGGRGVDANGQRGVATPRPIFTDGSPRFDPLSTDRRKVVEHHTISTPRCLQANHRSSSSETSVDFWGKLQAKTVVSTTPGVSTSTPRVLLPINQSPVGASNSDLVTSEVIGRPNISHQESSTSISSEARKRSTDGSDRTAEFLPIFHPNGNDDRSTERSSSVHRDVLPLATSTSSQSLWGTTSHHSEAPRGGADSPDVFVVVNETQRGPTQEVHSSLDLFKRVSVHVMDSTSAEQEEPREGNHLNDVRSPRSVKSIFSGKSDSVFCDAVPFNSRHRGESEEGMSPSDDLVAESSTPIKSLADSLRLNLSALLKVPTTATTDVALSTTECATSSAEEALQVRSHPVSTASTCSEATIVMNSPETPLTGEEVPTLSISSHHPSDAASPRHTLSLQSSSLTDSSSIVMSEAPGTTTPPWPLKQEESTKASSESLSPSCEVFGSAADEDDELPSSSLLSPSSCSIVVRPVGLTSKSSQSLLEEWISSSLLSSQSPSSYLSAQESDGASKELMLSSSVLTASSSAISAPSTSTPPQSTVPKYRCEREKDAVYSDVEGGHSTLEPCIHHLEPQLDDFSVDTRALDVVNLAPSCGDSSANSSDVDFTDGSDKVVNVAPTYLLVNDTSDRVDESWPLSSKEDDFVETIDISSEGSCGDGVDLMFKVQNSPRGQNSPLQERCSLALPLDSESPPAGVLPCAMISHRTFRTISEDCLRVLLVSQFKLADSLPVTWHSRISVAPAMSGKHSHEMLIVTASHGDLWESAFAAQKLYLMASVVAGSPLHSKLPVDPQIIHSFNSTTHAGTVTAWLQYLCPRLSSSEYPSIKSLWWSDEFSLRGPFDLGGVVLFNQTNGRLLIVPCQGTSLTHGVQCLGKALDLLLSPPVEFIANNEEFRFGRGDEWGDREAGGADEDRVSVDEAVQLIHLWSIQDCIDLKNTRYVIGRGRQQCKGRWNASADNLYDSRGVETSQNKIVFAMKGAPLNVPGEGGQEAGVVMSVRGYRNAEKSKKVKIYCETAEALKFDLDRMLSVGTLRHNYESHRWLLFKLFGITKRHAITVTPK
eukprot:GHVH01006716.1.p1 GENE.GHVH01006716.1~~GHVH01006716.1.p1  ORF type:complete len:1550 (+),score=253.76 GHVH01006716.1:128-4777(+)